MYFRLPYLGTHSNILKRNIRKIISEFYPQIDLKFLCQTQNHISDYFRFKDRLPLSLTSCVIYKYSCGQCSETYIGETRKSMKVRISQHRGVSFRTDRPLSNVNSKIFEHSSHFGHSINPRNFKIMDSGSEFDLRILESIHISDQNPSLNDKFSSYDLAILR